MQHHRSPTHSYPSLHATLALRHSIPTLLSPLTSIANTALDPPDEFQSNAWLSAPSCRPPLAGLGITCFGDASPNLYGQPFASEDPALRLQLDGDDGPLALPTGTHGTDLPLDDLLAQAVTCKGFASKEDDRLARFDLAPPLRDEPSSRMELGFDSDLEPMAGDAIGLIPDFNMYDKLRRSDPPHPGVNPLDTICGASFHDIGISYHGPVSLVTNDHHTYDTLSAKGSRAEQTPSPRVIQDIMSILVQPAPEFSFPPWSLNSPTAERMSPPQLATPRSSIPKVDPTATNVSNSERCPLPAPCSLEYSSTTQLSPVLNAHLGIELSELISRAERFRVEHPERDIDRAWLSHFAGKLSDRGELLNDFRCYVIGCDQRNKRRDHILVHVGAHIGQRPFACTVCPLRFLRKNECKRHEASHSGFRPYSCDICGQSFVRQDLVKRHVKRTHGVRDENQSPVTRQPSRKKLRVL